MSAARLRQLLHGLKVKEYVTVALLVGAVLVVLAKGELAVKSFRTLNDSQSWIAHTWRVIDTLDRVMGSLKDAETGSRGFALTDDETYLEPYNNGRRELPAELAALQQMTAAAPVQQLHLTDMRALIEMRMKLLQAVIDVTRSSNPDRGRILELVGTGKFEMDKVRVIATAMQDEEQRLLVERHATLVHNQRNAAVVVFFTVTIDLLLIGCVFWFLAQERKSRLAAEAGQEHLQRRESLNDAAISPLPLQDLRAEVLRRLLHAVAGDVGVLAKRRGEALIVEASEGIAIRPGTRIATGPLDPLRMAVEKDRFTVIHCAPSRASHAPTRSSLGGTSGLCEKAIPLPAAVDFCTESPFGFPGQQLRSMLASPMSVSGQVWGVLAVGRQGYNGFTAQDEELTALASGRIANAMTIDRAAAYETERASRQLAEERAEEVARLNAELETHVALRTAELESAVKELEAFSYSVSHDLRAPLRTVDGFSQALQEDCAGALTAECSDFLGRIRKGVQHMGVLIDSLLQLSRISRSEVVRETVDLSEMASELVLDLKEQNPGREIAFHIQPALTAEADPRLLRVGLENLLGNAVKFTAKQPHPVVEFGRSPESGEFYVSDNGAGFDMQYADKLFNAFQRLHGEKDFKGSGIGLATVARVVRRHHGTIRAEGHIDEGATFSFTLG